MSRLGRGFPNNALMRLPPPIPAVYDATGAGVGATGTSLSWSHNIAGSAVLVAINMEVAAASNPATATAKVGSTSMTQLKYVTSYGNSGGNYYTSLVVFGLLTPPTGSQTITITSSATTYSAANSVSYSNVSSFGTPASNTGNSATASVSATSASGQMVFNALANGPISSSDAFSAYSQTSRYNTTYNSNGFLLGDAAGASSVSFSANLAQSYYWAAVAVPLV